MKPKFSARPARVPTPVHATAGLPATPTRITAAWSLLSSSQVDAPHLALKPQRSRGECTVACTTTTSLRRDQLSPRNAPALALQNRYPVSKLREWGSLTRDLGEATPG